MIWVCADESGDAASWRSESRAVWVHVPCGFEGLPTIAVQEVALQFGPDCFCFLPRSPKARNLPPRLYYAQRPSNIAYTPRHRCF